MGPHPARRKLLIEQKRSGGRTVAPPPPVAKPPPPAVKLEPPPPDEIQGPPSTPPRPIEADQEIAKRRRRRASLVAAAWLRATYPDLFGYPPKPFAVGIGKSIVAAAIAAGQDKRGVRAAISQRAISYAYLEALAADGAMRCGLDGQPVEPVALERQVKAIDEIAAKAKRRSGALAGIGICEGDNDATHDPETRA